MNSIPNTHQRTGPNGEQGFTLIELLIVCVILPLVIGAISVGLIAVLQMNGGVASRLSGSGDAQVVSAYFVNDVQNAATLTTSGASHACGTTGTQVLGLSTSQTSISYAQVQQDTTYSLVRYLCKNGNTTPVISTVVSHDAGTPQVLLTCTTTAPGCATSALTSGISALGVATVKITITTQRDNYMYSITAVPRGWNGSAGGYAGQVTPPLLILGTTGTGLLSCSGSGNKTVPITVYGAVAINSLLDGAGYLQGSATMIAGAISTAANPAKAFTLVGGASVTPAPVTGPIVADPYTNLPAPNPVALGLTTYPTSTYKNETTTVQPGDYTSPFDVQSGATITLASGFYIFEQGISVASNATLIADPAGVFIYVPTGPVSIAGTASVTLNPLSMSSSPPPPAKNLVLWVAKGDVTPVIMTGTGAGAVVNGTIYAPSATVTTTGTGNLSAGAVWANSLSCQGTGGMTIGS